MAPQLIFGISVLQAFVVWVLIAVRYVWPALRGRPRTEALQPLLLLHAFRFVGLAFLVPGVVSPDLPDGFARPAAYGDFATSLLGLLSRSPRWKVGWAPTSFGCSTSSAPWIWSTRFIRAIA
jgi:hypothetical protein